jgi:hypothetical protein
MKTETWIDKSDWGPGPWQDENDRVEWHDPHSGLPCLLLRNPYGGFWCGYVGVPPRHPWHGWDYAKLPDVVQHAAHGELTYSDRCMDDPRVPVRDRICHLPKAGESDDVWWLGFDAAHLYDVRPGFNALMRRIEADEPPERAKARAEMREQMERFGMFDVYANQAYMMDRCKALAIVCDVRWHIEHKRKSEQR